MAISMYSSSADLGLGSQNCVMVRLYPGWWPEMGTSTALKYHANSAWIVAYQWSRYVEEMMEGALSPILNVTHPMYSHVFSGFLFSLQLWVVLFPLYFQGSEEERRCTAQMGIQCLINYEKVRFTEGLFLVNVFEWPSPGRKFRSDFQWTICKSKSLRLK